MKTVLIGSVMKYGVNGHNTVKYYEGYCDIGKPKKNNAPAPGCVVVKENKPTQEDIEMKKEIVLCSYAHNTCKTVKIACY